MTRRDRLPHLPAGKAASTAATTRRYSAVLLPEELREDMVANKNKVKSIEEQMAEFEARLRRQLAREKQHDQSKVQESFDTGAMPTIHVSLGALAASKPAPVEREYETVSGD